MTTPSAENSRSAPRRFGWFRRRRTAVPLAAVSALAALSLVGAGVASAIPAASAASQANLTYAASDTVTPVLSYNFDNDSGTTVSDSSGNGYDGTWTGTPSYGAGVSGSAAHVTAGHNVKLDYVPGVTDASGSFSFEFWIKENSYTGDSWIFANETGGSCTDAALGVFNASGSNGVLTGCYGTTAVHVGLNNAPIVGAWHQVAAVVDRTADTVSWYVDGQPAGAVTQFASSLSMDSGLPYVLGQDGNLNYTYNVDAYFDDVNFYDQAITPAQVEADYNATCGPVGCVTPPKTDPGTLTAANTSFNSGDTATFDYTMPADDVTNSNFVGWFPAGSDISATKPIAALTHAAPGASGTVSFDTTGVPAGKYDVYLARPGAVTTDNAVIAGPVTVTVTGDQPQLPSPGQLAGQPNLIVNGGAEIGDASSNGGMATTTPGWTAVGQLGEVQYGATGGGGESGFPGFNSPGAPDRGQNFFSEAFRGQVATGTQTVSVQRAEGQINQGNVSYNLGGWLGGTGSITDDASVTATFLDASGAEIGHATIGPVTAAMRNNTTELLPENVTGTLPKNTVQVRTVLTINGQAYADDLSFTISATVPAPPLPAPPVAQVPQFDHVFIVYMENSSYDEIIGNTAQAPYINSLLAQGANLTNVFAETHPSDANYDATASGTDNGLAGDSLNAQIPVQQIGDYINAAGGTWRTYMQSSIGPCDTGQQDTYDDEDTPFYNFRDVADNQAGCQEHLQPIEQMSVDLESAATTPNFVWFSANDCNDIEGCGITAGDTWLSQTLPTIFNSPAWTDQRSLLILSFDESDSGHETTPPDHIPAVILGSPGTVKAGFNSPVRYTQYSFTRTIEAALGLPSMTANDMYAQPINDIWTN